MSNIVGPSLIFKQPCLYLKLAFAKHWHEEYHCTIFMYLQISDSNELKAQILERRDFEEKTQ